MFIWTEALVIMRGADGAKAATHTYNIGNSMMSVAVVND
jgi:hypothetical protein